MKANIAVIALFIQLIIGIGIIGDIELGGSLWKTLWLIPIFIGACKCTDIITQKDKEN